MHLLRKTVIAGGLSLALVGTGAGVAAADTPRPPAGQQQTAPRPAPAAVIGTVVRADTRTLVVRTPDRRTTQFGLTARTEITKNGRRAAATRVSPGDRVRVTADRGVATRVDVTGR